MKRSTLLSAAILLASAAPAGAAELIFTFTGNSWINGAHGNARSFTDTGGTVNVRATGWSLQGSTIRDSYLGAWSHGLGVTSGDENGYNNTHAVDNHYRRDFILLQFDRAVNLTGATFNTYAVGGTARDSDATVGYGTIAADWQSVLPLDGHNVAALNAMLDGSFISLGGRYSNTRTLTDGTLTGNLWMIGAAWTNADQKIDSFKLAGITAEIPPPAVPEPATWALMLIGFGATGLSLRRRPGGKALPAN